MSPVVSKVARTLRPALLILCCAGFLPAQNPSPARRVVAISHRGEHLHHPENTIPAFAEAIRVGADFIEVDVQTTSDGKLVLSHDSTVDRCTNGTGNVRDMTFEQVARLDAGIKSAPEFAGTRVPTFDEVLKMAHGRIGVYVDLKNATAQAIVDAIQKSDMVERVVIYRGSIPLLKEIQAIDPRLKVMPESRNMENVKSAIESLHPKVIAFGASDFFPEIIKISRDSGAAVYVDRMGKTDAPEGWQSAIDDGADGIQTDLPGPLVEYLRSRGYKRP
jgi:glycerophosphoryl diester phosphodiesterase